MKQIKFIGLAILLGGVGVFSSALFIPSFELSEVGYEEAFEGYNDDNRSRYMAFSEAILSQTEGKTYPSVFAFSADVRGALAKRNEVLKGEEKWDEVIWDKPHEFASLLAVPAAKGPINESTGLFLFLTFGLAIIGGVMFILPDVILQGKPGIKNDHIFHHPATNRGWIGWVVFAWLVSFYVLLYFFPDYVIGWSMITDPVSMLLKNAPGGRWFLYGTLYCTVMTVMAIRMFVKYRGNRYQIFRTSSVLFFQICFAFLIPEIMTRFGAPGVDLKEIWPLDYDFFFDWNLRSKLEYGTLGIFLLVWGLLLIVVGVPVMVYFFGKRWYCSWVCGCGGLAETLGDPYRQLSDKSIKSWKIERYLIHGVLVFAVFMTGMTLFTYFSGVTEIASISTNDIQGTYKFMIGSVFAGVIGTGFYPAMGSRVWCRFGCPLAAYLGFVQRFKSRFRITTNGGQCISCGNCSTYCEMGIDVRWYAQRGQNIVRSSCVGCGICSAVCPRGVLNLENGPEEDRINENPILIGKEGIQLSLNVTSQKG